MEVIASKMEKLNAHKKHSPQAANASHVYQKVVIFAGVN